MVEHGGGTTIPVIMSDGKREINIGNLRIQPTSDNMLFHLMITQRIGLSPNQITSYIVRRNNSNPEDHREFPITGKLNFALICQVKDCVFDIVLKRSIERKNKTAPPYAGEYFSSPSLKVDNVTLLRRDQPLNLKMNNNYVVAMMPWEHYPKLQETYAKLIVKKPKKQIRCKQCETEQLNGDTAAFHPCVNDEVVVEFKTEAGAIKRP